MEFAYDLARDMTKSGYPTYADGIKTKEDFILEAERAFSSEDEEILLFEEAGRVLGWIHYYHLREARYLGTRAFCVKSGMKDALAEFIAFARARFPGSDLYLGFPRENTEAVAALEALGFSRIEESCNNVLCFDDYTLQPENTTIIPITRENYGLFSDLHSRYEEEMYWTSARILSAMDRWKIYVYLQGGKAAGAVYWTKDALLSEIFGVDLLKDDVEGDICRALLTAALNEEKRSGAKFKVFFCEERFQRDALACGFRCVGGYVCYKTELVGGNPDLAIR